MWLDIRRFVADAGAVTMAAISPDQRLLLTAHDDGMVRSWDVETGRKSHRLDGHTGAVTAVTFLPDGGRAFPPVLTAPCGCGT